MARIANLKRNKDMNGLITILTEGSIDDAVEAARALGELRDKIAVKPLIKALHSQHTDLRVMAVRALGNIKEEEAVTPLIYALPIGGPLTTASSIALKKILGDKTVDLFIKILKGEVNGAKDIVARWNAAETLGSLKNTRAVQPLIDVLHDENEHLRERVAFSLGIIGDERAVEPIIEVLKDNSKAARALGMINNRRAVEPLIEALKDENQKKRVVNRVCQDIIWALGRLGDKRAFAPLQKCLDNEDFYVQLEAKKALQKIAKKIT